MSVSRSKITGYGRRKNRSRSNVHIHIYCQPELANQIASSSLSPQKSSQLPKKKQLQTEKTALWMASFWYRLLLATVMGYQTSHNPGRQPVHVVTEACWMGSLEKPDDSTYGVYIHIATYILFIYYSYHIYIYIRCFWVAVFFCFWADLKSPYQTYVKKPTNNVERRNPHRHFLGTGGSIRWRNRRNRLSRAQKKPNREPCLHQKRLQKVGKPEAFRISIHHGEQSRLHWHHHPWCDGSLGVTISPTKKSHHFLLVFQTKNGDIIWQKTVKVYGNTLSMSWKSRFCCFMWLLVCHNLLTQPSGKALIVMGNLPAVISCDFRDSKKIKAFRVWGDQKNTNNDNNDNNTNNNNNNNTIIMIINDSNNNMIN